MIIGKSGTMRMGMLYRERSSAAWYSCKLKNLLGKAERRFPPEIKLKVLESMTVRFSHWVGLELNFDFWRQGSWRRSKLNNLAITGLFKCWEESSSCCLL
jgi:hypothetical protein